MRWITVVASNSLHHTADIWTLQKSSFLRFLNCATYWSIISGRRRRLNLKIGNYKNLGLLIYQLQKLVFQSKNILVNAWNLLSLSYLLYGLKQKRKIIQTLGKALLKSTLNNSPNLDETTYVPFCIPDGIEPR